MLKPLRSFLNHSAESNEGRIYKNAWIYSLGNYFNKFFSIIIFPVILARLGLEQTGKYDLIISTIAILSAAFSFKINEGIYRWLSDPNIEIKRVGFSNGILLSVLVLALSLVGYWIISSYFQYDYLLIGTGILISQIASTVFMDVLRGTGKIKLYSFLVVATTLIFLCGAFLVVFYTDKQLQNMLLIMLISNVVTLFIAMAGSDWKTLWRKDLISTSELRAMLSFSFPVMLNALSWMLIINFNKYLISQDLGHEQNGIFAVAEKFASFIPIIGLFFYRSAQDFFLSSPEPQKQIKPFRSLMKKVVRLVLIGLVLLTFCSWLLMPLFFPDFVITVQYIPLMALVNMGIVLASYLGIPYIQQKHTSKMAITTILGAILTMTLSFLLIRSMALYGVYLSIITGVGLILYLRIVYSKRLCLTLQDVRNLHGE